MKNISIKSAKEIEIMREGGKIHAEIMHEIKKNIKEGITTNQLNQIALNFCDKFLVVPSFLGFQGFPSAICTSINEEIVHGIPSNRALREGDIIGVDLGVLYKNFHTDACQTFAVGNISKNTKKLIETTKKCLKNAISIIKEGIHLGDISHIIQITAEKEGFNIVKNLTGHGIGRELHEPPQILNYGKKRTGPVLRAGMTLAIEPIVTSGEDYNYTLDDDWTIVTEDGELSAHFEHTILITKNGSEVLT